MTTFSKEPNVKPIVIGISGGLRISTLSKLICDKLPISAHNHNIKMKTALRL